MRRPYISLCLVLWLALTLVRAASAAPGHCEIELINSGHETADVLVAFDNHTTSHFVMHPYDAPHYVSLHYFGFCHSGAHIHIEARRSSHDQVVYDAWTRTNSTVRIVSH